MAKFAFITEATASVTETYLGFSWNTGGFQNTAVYSIITIAAAPFTRILTLHPADIPGGFPGLNGNRIFLDIMGTSVMTGYLDVDLKIYAPQSQTPIYQAPTFSIEVIGLNLASLTINGNVNRGGIVAGNGSRQFIAGRLNLISPADLPQLTPSEAASAKRIDECAKHAAPYQVLGPGGALGRLLGCYLE